MAMVTCSVDAFKQSKRGQNDTSKTCVLPLRRIMETSVRFASLECHEHYRWMPGPRDRLLIFLLDKSSMNNFQAVMACASEADGVPFWGGG